LAGRLAVQDNTKGLIHGADSSIPAFL
jgi:hypothetical protein